MTQEKLSVRKIREILRLKYEVGLSNRAIARACCISNSTVGDYVVRARRAGLAWPVAEERTEEELYRQLFPEVKKPQMEERRYARLESSASRVGAPGSYTATAVAGVPGEISGWVWIHPVSGALPALEPGSHHQHASAPQGRRGAGGGLCGDDTAHHQPGDRRDLAGACVRSIAACQQLCVCRGPAFAGTAALAGGTCARFCLLRWRPEDPASGQSQSGGEETELL